MITCVWWRHPHEGGAGPVGGDAPAGLWASFEASASREASVLTAHEAQPDGWKWLTEGRIHQAGKGEVIREPKHLPRKLSLSQISTPVCQAAGPMEVAARRLRCDISALARCCLFRRPEATAPQAPPLNVPRPPQHVGRSHRGEIPSVASSFFLQGLTAPLGPVAVMG